MVVNKPLPKPAPKRGKTRSKKGAKVGKRVLIYLPYRYWKMSKDIENLSAFVQLCLDDAAGIMAFNILHQMDPKKYPHTSTMKEVKNTYNETFPLPELVKRRINKETICPKNSPSKPELW